MVEGAQAWIRVVLDPLARSEDLLRLVLDDHGLDAHQPPELVSSHEMLLGAAAWLLDETEAANRHLLRGGAQMQLTHMTGQLSQTLRCLGQVQFDLADFAEADRTGRTLIDLGEAEAIAIDRDTGLALRSREAAVRGDIETAQEMADDARSNSRSASSGLRRPLMRHTFGYMRFSEHDQDGCFDQLPVAVRPQRCAVPRAHLLPGASGTSSPPPPVPAAPPEVQPVMDEAERRLTIPGTRHRLVLARARALLAGDDAEGFHVLATGDARAGAVALRAGQRRAGVRRAGCGDIIDPRTPAPTSSAAADVFDRLGTRAWAELAHTELRAAGVTFRRHPPAARMGRPHLPGAGRSSGSRRRG